MPRKKTQRDDYDGAWKEAIETYLRDFPDLFFAEASAGIDWSLRNLIGGRTGLNA